MKTNIKQITLTLVIACMFSFTMPSTRTDAPKIQQHENWAKWIKIGSAATIITGVCAWLYLDTHIHSLIRQAIQGSQQQFVEDLKHHAAFNNDGTPRKVISAATSYMSAPEAEVLKNTQASLKLLNTDFKPKLFLNQILSKICALTAALSFYVFIEQTEEIEPQISALKQEKNEGFNFTTLYATWLDILF